MKQKLAPHSARTTSKVRAQGTIFWRKKLLNDGSKDTEAYV